MSSLDDVCYSGPTVYGADMNKMRVMITISVHGNSLNVKLRIGDSLTWTEGRIWNDLEGNLVLFWLLSKIKPVFSMMPLEEIRVDCTREAIDKFGNIISKCLELIDNTNNLIKANVHLKGVASEYRKILIINVDGNMRYVSLYNDLKRIDEKRLLYMNMDSGYNKTLRRWEKKPVPIAPKDLVDRVVNDGVGKAVSFNHYFLESYVNNENLYLPPLFSFLGMQYIIIDNDPYESGAGFLSKAFYNDPSSDRWSIAPTLHAYWDDSYGLKNVRYAAIPQDYGDERPLDSPGDDYDILVLSHSRVQNVKRFFGPILYILGQMDDKAIFTEVSLWYWALRYMVLNIMDFGELEKVHFSGLLSSFYYAITQFVKYEVIESIESPRKTAIYGDSGWALVFPELYQNRYMSGPEMEALQSEKGHLYLMVNGDFVTYLDAPGAMYDYMRRNVPFISLPPIVRPKLLRGIRHIEYRNKKELNTLIADAERRFENQELREGIKHFKEALRGSKEGVENQIMNERGESGGNFLYEDLRKDSETRLEQVTQDYVDRNEGFLRETFSVLFQGKQVSFDATRSRYLRRSYAGRIAEGMETG